MSGNRGNTSLKKKRRSGDPMREFDRLSPEVRAWLASAILPWRPKSAQRAFDRAYSRTQDTDQALSELDRMQEKLIARDAREIWGEGHPSATQANA
ncbi:DUF6525 family protein [Tropicimonas marinistellae]|uniref:DUF6525 family protein n=1 Tax=Tropicimonas marinistellae TaxID=1739787 RepID=UPI00082AF373|nr:DUF6525 family protein [Tropicimonas marinistellae]